MKRKIDLEKLNHRSLITLLAQDKTARQKTVEAAKKKMRNLTLGQRIIAFVWPWVITIINFPKIVRVAWQTIKK
jgi:hypothetical protein